MAGLLDFMQTPQGIGLLSAVAGGLAGARRGTPINNLGRGAAAGLMGYQSAQEQMRKDQEDAATKLALQNAIAAGTVNTITPGQSPFAMVGGNAYANPADANFELAQNKAINAMNQPPLNLASKINPGSAQTFPLPMSHVIPRSALSSVAAEDSMMSKIYDDFANPIQPTSEPDVYRNDLLTAWAPEQAAPASPLLPEQAQQFAGTPDRVTQDFDLGKTAKAMIQSGRPELMTQGLKMLSEIPKSATPQLVDTWDEKTGRTVKKWVMPGQADGVQVGYGKPEDNGLKPTGDLANYIYARDNGMLKPGEDFTTWKRNNASSGAPKVINNITNSTEKKFGEKFAEAAASQDMSTYEAAQKAPELAARSNRIKQVLASGNVITGIGADARLAIGKALGLVGASDNETIANTEALSADLSKNTLDAIKASGLGSGNGFSNADRDFLEKAAGGKITLEAATLARLADLSHRAASLSAQKWNGRVKAIPQSAIEGTGISRDPITVPPLFGAAPQAREGQTGKSKSGRPIIYRNGQWEYK